MFQIFNGNVRGLGENPQQGIWLKMSVDFRNHLHHFKGAKLAVFMDIAMHSDPQGWCDPSVERMASETGYNHSTISDALTDLCNTTIDGNRVLLVVQERTDGKFLKNRYLLFPSAAEIEKYESVSRKTKTVSEIPTRKNRIGFTDAENPTESRIPSKEDSVSSKDETGDASKPAVQKQDAAPSEPVAEKKPADAADSAMSARKELTPGEALQKMLDGMDDKDHLPAGFSFKPYMRLFKQLLKDGWTEDDFRRAGKIIRKWNDANGSPMYPASAGDFIILIKEALGLVKRGFKSQHIADFVRAEKQQDFWRGRQVGLPHVAKNIKAVDPAKRVPTTEERLALEAYIRSLPIEQGYVAPNHAL